MMRGLRYPSKTFVLGAGFSADAGFPLMRNLSADVLAWIEMERTPDVEAHLTPSHWHPEGQFYACLNAIDPDRSKGFEEFMIAIRDRLAATHEHDPCYVVARAMRDACGHLLWRKQPTPGSLPDVYRNFASWFNEHRAYGRPNAIISLNWDLLVERALTDANVGWEYTTQSPMVPILKPHGSINWRGHAEHVLPPPAWQPIAQNSPYLYLRRAPLVDPFETWANQRLRKLILPGDPEDEAGTEMIWAEAEEAIREREVVVFIGYSLPPYDALSTGFFQRATKDKQVEVYTRSPETLARYSGILGSISSTRPLAFAACPYAKPFVEAAA
jgi:hypothetical protein